MMMGLPAAELLHRVDIYKLFTAVKPVLLQFDDQYTIAFFADNPISFNPNCA